MERFKAYFAIFSFVTVAILVVGSVAAGSMIIASWDPFIRACAAFSILIGTVLGIGAYEEHVR